MIQNNKVYDILKYIALIGLPAVGLFLAQIGDIWNVAYMPQIVKTIDAIGVFAGALLGVSSYKYHKKIENKEEKK